MMEVTLDDVLRSREDRVAKQMALLNKYHHTIVCLTLNIPGKVKVFELVEEAFNEGYKKIIDTLNTHIIYEEKEVNITGYVGYFVVELDNNLVKKKMVEIEDANDLGRLFDIDVISCDGGKTSRQNLNLSSRKCLLCDNDAFYCSRSRNHSVDELVKRIKEILNEYFKRTNK
ncbi:MAG: citrate lyase holo-[acyl-carrier protein] synthase [Bacilli bacterium]